jgi:hypothetical protein
VDPFPRRPSDSRPFSCSAPAGVPRPAVETLMSPDSDHHFTARAGGRVTLLSALALRRPAHTDVSEGNFPAFRACSCATRLQVCLQAGAATP